MKLHVRTTRVAAVVDPAAPPKPPDVELVALVAQGDRAALDELYRRHSPWLMARLNRRCGDPDLVDTAVQDAFLDVWRKATNYRPTGEVAAWIWTIGIRRLIDLLRKRPAPTPIGEDHFAQVIAEEVPLALGHTAMGQAFARLDPELQAVVAVTALDGLTNKEAGRLLNIPTGTVKSRLARARTILQEVAP